jgi:hypothetical protein
MKNAKATQRPTNPNASLSGKKRIQELEEQAIASGATEEFYVVSCGINTLGAFRIIKQAQSWAKNIGVLYINNTPVRPCIEQLHCIVSESHGEETAKPVGRVGECYIGFCVGFENELWSIPLMGKKHPLYEYWDKGFDMGYLSHLLQSYLPCPYTEPVQVEAWEDGREEGGRRAIMDE